MAYDPTRFDVNVKIRDQEAEIKRLRLAFVETARLLTLEQLQEMSRESVAILADLGFLGKTGDRTAVSESISPS